MRPCEFNALRDAQKCEDQKRDAQKQTRNAQSVAGLRQKCDRGQRGTGSRPHRPRERYRGHRSAAAVDRIHAEVEVTKTSAALRESIRQGLIGAHVDRAEWEWAVAEVYRLEHEKEELKRAETQG
jgi:hypothetical protein